MYALMLWSPGYGELILIVVAVLLLFGAKRLPEILRNVGSGIKEFKKSVRETTDDVKGSLDVDKPSSGDNRPKESANGENK